MAIRPSTPGSGKDAASASTAPRAARESRRQVWIVRIPCVRRHVPAISPSTRRAPGQTREVHSPRRRSTSGTRSSAIGAPQKEVCVPAREEARGRRRPARSPEGRLVTREDPCIPDRCSHCGQRPAERVECLDTSLGGEPRPLGERRGCGGTEDVQVSTRELEASESRFDLRCRHGPDDRLSRTVPTDQDRAGRRGVAEPVGVDAERSSRLAVRHPRRRRGCARSRAAMSSATRRGPASSGSLPSVKTARSRAATTYAWCRGPQSWISEGSSQVVGPGSLDARMDREEGGARHAVLQARPRRLPQGAATAREPFVERADVPPEREDLRPGQAEPDGRRHVRRSQPPMPRSRRMVVDRASGLLMWSTALEDRPYLTRYSSSIRSSRS